MFCAYCKLTNLCISTCSMSPEKEKNSLMSCSVALRETFVTFTVVTCHDQTLSVIEQLQRETRKEAKIKPNSTLHKEMHNQAKAFKS